MILRHRKDVYKTSPKWLDQLLYLSINRHLNGDPSTRDLDTSYVCTVVAQVIRWNFQVPCQTSEGCMGIWRGHHPQFSSGLPGCWKWDFVGFTGGYIPLASQLEESTSADAVEDCKTLVPMAAALRCLETDPGRNALVMWESLVVEVMLGVLRKVWRPLGLTSIKMCGTLISEKRQGLARVRLSETNKQFFEGGLP